MTIKDIETTLNRTPENTLFHSPKMTISALSTQSRNDLRRNQSANALGIQSRRWVLRAREANKQNARMIIQRIKFACGPVAV
jgi:hypothetical protein